MPAPFNYIPENLEDNTSEMNSVIYRLLMNNTKWITCKFFFLSGVLSDPDLGAEMDT